MGRYDGSNSQSYIYDPNKRIVSYGTVYNEIAYLDNLIDYNVTSYDFWKLGYPIHINNNGWIIGKGWIDDSPYNIYGERPTNIFLMIPVDENYIVTFKMYADLAAEWMKTGESLKTDFNRNRTVDVNDLTLLSKHWLTYCPPSWNL